MKNIRFGVIGTNFISDQFCDAACLVAGVEISAIYSRKFDTGAAFAKKHGIEHVFSDLEEMLSSDVIDSAYVASPTFLHCEHTLLAAAHEKHVLCEKACAITYHEFEKMTEATGKAGVVFLEAMRPAFDPLIEALRENLYRIGKVRRFRFEFCKYSSRYDKFKQGIIENAFDVGMKNSSLSDIGVYPLWLAVSLFGADCAFKNESVFLENGFQGSGEILMSYGDVLGTVSYSKITEGHGESFIEGENGALVINKISAPTMITYVSNDGTRNEIASSSCKNNMIYEIEYFKHCIEGICSPHEHNACSADVMRIIDNISSDFF